MKGAHMAYRHDSPQEIEMFYGGVKSGEETIFSTDNLLVF